MRIVQAVSGATPRGPTFALQGSHKKRKRKKLEIYWKNNERKIPSFGKGNRHASPGSTHESQTRWMQRGSLQDT